jgi:hypothetical protein
VDTLKQSLQEFQELEKKHLGQTTLKSGDILKVLVFLLRLAYTRTSGRPRSRGFLHYLQMSFSGAVETGSAAEGAGSRLILP